MLSAAVQLLDVEDDAEVAAVIAPADVDDLELLGREARPHLLAVETVDDTGIALVVGRAA